MTHYASCIREYGAADNFDTEHSEAAHKYHVKAFYGRTNKRQGYEDQICLHNTRRINMLAMTNVLFHKKSRYTTQSGNDIEAQVSVPPPCIERPRTHIVWEKFVRPVTSRRWYHRHHNQEHIREEEEYDCKLVRSERRVPIVRLEGVRVQQE